MFLAIQPEGEYTHCGYNSTIGSIYTMRKQIN